MAANDPIPLFLSEQHDQPDIGKDRAVISSRIVKTSILIVTAAAIVFAIVAVGNPLVLFESATASLFAPSTPQDDTGLSMPSTQSTADAQALPPTASAAPTSGEIAVASKTADQGQAEIRQPPGDVLLNKFQAWAAEADARPQVQRAPPVQEEDARPQGQRVQPVQDAQAPVVEENARAPVRHLQKQRQVRRAQNARAKNVRNARAQMRRAQDARAQAQPEQNAQAQGRPVQDAQAPARPVQDAQPSWLPQSLGWRN
jgi:flagellar biosynthesis GTPase FlhF